MTTSINDYSAIMLPLLVLCLFTPAYTQLQIGVTVHTLLGDVAGLATPIQGQMVFFFLGIPYAQPPVGPRRLQKPVPIQAWSRIRDGTQFAPSCPQTSGGVGPTNEDCLYLNVYTPVNVSVVDSSFTTSSSLKAVMVWVHGGGFVAGAGRSADGSVMAARGDVVVVTINYRLGMLGFLSTLDSAIPGNYGLWDQRMAFQWVRDNIATFGGDPNKVTIFGESAGGYSVGLHAVSPINQGLFQRAIMQSGSTLGRRTIALNPVDYAQRFGENLDCVRRTAAGFDSRYLAECVRQRTVEAILAATVEASRLTSLVYRLDVAPVIDGELLPEDARTLLGPTYRERIPFWNLDIMVGTTNGEGSLVLFPLVQFQQQLGFNAVDGIPTRVLCTNISSVLARDYFHGSENISRAMCAEYTVTSGDDAEQGRAVVNLYGDMMFVSSALETLLLHVSSSSGTPRGSFQYLFSHQPRRSGLLTYPWFRGAGHGEEVNFVFGMSLTDPDEVRLSVAMMAGWFNFAKFGTPNNPQNQTAFLWPSFDAVTRAYTVLDINVTAQHDLYSERMDFWLRRIAPLPSDPQIGFFNQGSGTSSAGHSRTTEQLIAASVLCLLSTFSQIM